MAMSEYTGATPEPAPKRARPAALVAHQFGKGGVKSYPAGHPKAKAKGKHKADPKAKRHGLKSNFIADAIKHPGKLTAQVGGKPGQHMGQVDKLASSGDKAAQFFKNVLNKK